MAHARDAAEAAETRSKVAALDAEQRRADAAVRREAVARRRSGTARSGAAPCRGEAGRGAESPPNGSRPPARGRGAAARDSLADIDPKWNVDGNERDDGRRTSMRPSTPPSRTTKRLGRLRGVLSDEAADARFRQQLGRRGGRFTAADLDDALATAEALQRRVSRVKALFAVPGGDTAVAHDARATGTRPGRARGRRPTSSARSMSPSGDWTGGRRRPGSTGWFSKRNRCSPMPRPQRDGERARALASSPIPAGRAGASRGCSRIAPAQSPSPPSGPSRPAPPGLVKRLFEWLRERVREDCCTGFRPSKAAHRQDRSRRR